MTVLAQSERQVTTVAKTVAQASIAGVRRWAVSARLSAAGTVQVLDPLGAPIASATTAAAGKVHLAGWADVPAIEVAAQAAAGTLTAAITIYGRPCACGS